MDKAAQKYFQRRMADLVAEATDVLAVAQPVLARADSPREPNIPTSHYQHQADIVFELIIAQPGIVGEIALLLQFGEHAKARKRVKEALEALRAVDPALFLPAPSPRLAARLLVGTNADSDTWTSAVASATYANNDDRRRTVLPFRRKLLESGEPLPDEDDVADLLTRDQAIAAQMIAGAGARASRKT